DCREEPMTKLNTRLLNIAVMLGALLVLAPPLRAQGVSGDVVKIGIMNDQTGPYADNCGPGSVAAAKLAVSDFGGTVNGKKIEIVVADDRTSPTSGSPSRCDGSTMRASTPSSAARPPRLHSPCRTS